MKIRGRRVAHVGGAALVLVVLVAGALAWYISMWRQAPDPDFDTRVATPAFKSGGPIVLFDEAHFNAHGIQTTYAPFAALLGSDGFRLKPNSTRFRADLLQGIDILVIVNARGSDVAGRRGDPAFTTDEINVISDWVASGGSLLLVADHAPYGSAAGELAQRFGVAMSNADTVDPEHHDPVSGKAGFLLFSRQNGLLRPHSIVEGRSQSERIQRVLTFNGQSLSGPAESALILALSDTARDVLPDGSEMASKGSVQGLALEPGKGRVVVLGEAAMLTAQIAQVPFQPEFRAGMNRDDADNRQFTLNLMHWLARLNE